MASVSPNRLFLLPTVDGDVGLWGGYLDSNWSGIDLMLGGRAALNVAGSSNYALTAAEAQNLILNLTGVLTGSINLILPALGALYIVNNGTTGNFTVTVITSAGGSTGAVVPQGYKQSVYSDATNVSANGVAVSTSGQSVALPGSSSGTTVLSGAASGGGAITLPAGNHTLAQTDSPTFTGVPVLADASATSLTLTGATAITNGWNRSAANTIGGYINSALETQFTTSSFIFGNSTGVNGPVAINLRNATNGASSTSGINFGNDDSVAEAQIYVTASNNATVGGAGRALAIINNAALGKVVISGIAGVLISQLAGTGLRAVFADANGKLSAP